MATAKLAAARRQCVATSPPLSRGLLRRFGPDGGSDLGAVGLVVEGAHQLILLLTLADVHPLVHLPQS